MATKTKKAGSGAEKAKKPNPALEPPLKKSTKISTWKGRIALGIIQFPVRAYVAAETDKIERHMYHSADCLNRMKNDVEGMICTGCKASVPKAEVVKGVEVDDKVILVSDAEMKAQELTPVDGVELNIREFLPIDAIDVTYYASTELLAPGEDGGRPYETFRVGLVEEEIVGIGDITYDGHQYTVAVRSYQQGLAISYLYSEHEMRQCDKWRPDVQTRPAEVMMMKEYMRELKGTRFTPAPYDQCLQRQREMIKHKVNGEPVPSVDVKQTTQDTVADDMMAKILAMLADRRKGKAKAAQA